MAEMTRDRMLLIAKAKRKRELDQFRSTGPAVPTGGEPVPEEGPGVASTALDYALRALDYPGGIARTAAAGGVTSGPLPAYPGDPEAEIVRAAEARAGVLPDVNKPVLRLEDLEAALRGKAPSSGEYMARAAAPEAQEAARAAGLIGDVLYDPFLAGGTGGKAVTKPIAAAERIASRKISPVVTEMFTGVPRQASRTFLDNPQAVKDLTRSGVTSTVEEAVEDLSHGVAKTKMQIGENLGTVIERSGEKVDISKTKDLLQKHIDKLEEYAKEVDTPSARREIKAARKAYQDMFGLSGKEIPDRISAKAAFKFQDTLRDLADLGKTKTGPASRHTATQTRAEKQLADAAAGGYRELNKEFERVTSGISPKLKDQYREYSNIQKRLQPMFASPERAYTTLTTLDAKGRKTAFELLEKLQKEQGINVFDRAKLLEAEAFYGRPAWTPLTRGTTSTSRTLSLGGIGGAIGYKYGDMPGMVAGIAAGGAAGSPAMAKKLYQLGLGVERAGQLMPKTPLYETIRMAPVYRRENQ